MINEVRSIVCILINAWIVRINHKRYSVIDARENGVFESGLMTIGNAEYI